MFDYSENREEVGRKDMTVWRYGRSSDERRESIVTPHITYQLTVIFFAFTIESQHHTDVLTSVEY